MFYCEACRVIERWPKSFRLSMGGCEVCQESMPCHDVQAHKLPVFDEKRMKTLCLLPTEVNEFSLSKLMGKRYFRVIRVVQKVAVKDGEAVTVEYDDGDLISPQSDPLIIGTLAIPRNGSAEYVPHIVWNEKLWRTIDEGTENLYEMLTGVKGDDVKKFAERLRKNGFPGKLGKVHAVVDDSGVESKVA